MLALVMCLLVLAVAGTVVLRDGLGSEVRKPATPRPARRRTRASAGAALLAMVTGVGVLVAAGIGLLAGLLVLWLRNA